MRAIKLTTSFALLLLAGTFNTAFAQSAADEKLAQVAMQVRKKLVMLPTYGVFDYLTFSVALGDDGYNVQLGGSTSRPGLRKAAEAEAKRVTGVLKVDNQIDELPVSRFDDDIRRAAYIKIYGTSGLSRYNPNGGMPVYGMNRNRGLGISADPPMGIHPIHIIVKNGAITLEGVVDIEMDKNLAGIMANQVPGAMKVTNNLAVRSPAKPKKKG